MLKKLIVFAVITSIIANLGCARRGNITGGAKDTIPPILKYSLPKNFSTNFKGNEFTLFFDEYIKVKDAAKQLIVSPPMKIAPNVLPTNPSKTIKVTFKDTLQPNTTYSFNFGSSLQDNNEGNPYPSFKYVFSTGNEIDSLQIQGTIKDALERKTDNFVSVLLFERSEKYSDSAIYKQKPRYVTNTLDSSKTWKIENIKAGKYILIALKDYNGNNNFESKKDKIGFYKEEVTVPSTQEYQLKLFKEQQLLKFFNPKQASGNRAYIGFEGNADQTTAILKNGNQVLDNIITRVPKKDSLQIWFKKIKVDSLELQLANKEFSKRFYFKIKDQKRDTLSFSPSQTGNLNFRDGFSITSTTPIIKIDDSKFSLRNKDSVAVPFTKKYDVFNQQLIFDFKKEENEKYVVQILPGAFTDYYDKKNDTLTYKLQTKSLTDFGSVIVTLEQAKRFPIVAQLVSDTGTILASESSDENPVFKFEGLEPNKYYLRIIYDDNKNKQWDPGNFLKNIDAEEVIYYPEIIDVRANWDRIYTFKLQN